MTAIHEALNEARAQCQALAKEMEAFKKSRAIHDKMASSLEATCKVLDRTTEAIQPFSELRVKGLVLIMVVSAGINSLMCLFTLLVVLFKA